MATVPQIVDLWHDPPERHDIFMNNYTEHTWTLVVFNHEVKKLMQSYIQYPCKLQSESYMGPITILVMNASNGSATRLKTEGFDLPMPSAGD